MNTTLLDSIKRMQNLGLVTGVICLAAAGFGGTLDLRQFHISYLNGYIFWLGLALGCLGVSLIHHLSGGQWGFVTRRFLEAGYLTLPLLAVLFLPIAFGLRELYPWARPETVAASHALIHKQVYLNPTAWGVRTAVYFLIWIGMALTLRRGSLRQDRSSDPAATVGMRTWSGPGLVLYPLTGTFALIDWVMSLEPEWHSTIFLVILLIGQILCALAWVTLMLLWARNSAPFFKAVHSGHFLDLGNLILAFVVFWTYVSFSQWLIVYAANLPGEITWYLHRTKGGWEGVLWFLALFHFALPFLLLLFRDIKLNPSLLAKIAGSILVAHAIAGYWTIMPSFHPDGPQFHWQDLATWLGLGGLWSACFAAVLRRQPWLPKNDPRMAYSAEVPVHEH